MVQPQPVRCYGRASVTLPTIKGAWNTPGAGVPLVKGTGRPDPATIKNAVTVTRANVGYVRVVAGGQDVTFFRGVPCVVTELSLAEPFGPETATIVFPSVTPFDDLTAEPFAWIADGNDVDIELCTVLDDTLTTLKHLFTGAIVAKTFVTDAGTKGKISVSVEVQGVLYASADGVLAQPQVAYDTADIGTVIADALNNLPETRVATVKPVVTGVTTRSTGAWEPLLTGRVGDLLASATTQDGTQQWTLHVDEYRKPVIRLKDYTTINWTTSVGAPGVSIDVTVDTTTAPTAVYGRGVDPDSQGWGNLRAPGFHSLHINRFPYNDPNTIIDETVSGEPVTAIQTVLNTNHGYQLTVDGVYGTATRDAVTRFQRAAGVPVTGTVNAHTWLVLHGIEYRKTIGQFAGLGAAYYAPLAATPASQKYLYDTSGAIQGGNPAYNPSSLPRHRFHSYPDGTTKTVAISYAEQELARDKDAGATGTIVFENVDPQQGSRWYIEPGHNIAVRNFGGQTLVFHVNHVNHTPDTTTLTVDSKARDLLTLDAMVTRNRDALGPGQSPSIRRQSILTPGRPIVDGELIGNIPNMALNANRWNTFAIPLGVEGDIVKMWVQTNHPWTRFVMAFFSGQVSHQAIAKIVTDPFTQVVEGDDTFYPFPGNETTAAKLEEMGWIDTLGGPNNLGGYYPGTQEKSTTVTGRHEDATISLHFESFLVPYVWVAVYPEQSCWIDGKVWIAPQGS